MLYKAIHYFYPELKEEEIRKFKLLASIFFLIIGTYWLLRLLKNTIFLKVAFPEILGWLPQQGVLFQPTAKFWSPAVVLIIVLIYSKLIDIFKKHQLFYIICSIYAAIFLYTTGILLVKEWYGVEAIGRTLLASTGWISYFAIESFGSLVVALFWSFTNSITDSKSAQYGFPLIVAMAQMGAIAGSGLLFFSDSIGSLWPILLLTSILLIGVMFMVYYFMATMPADQLIGNKVAAATEKEKEGFFKGFISGFTLLVTRPYLLGVLVVSTFYEAVGQIVEYQMQRQACLSPTYASDVAFAKFQATYGLSINTLSFFIALLGTSYIIKRFGTRITLLIYPITFAITLLALFTYFQVAAPTVTTLLWLTFGAMVIIKGMGYALNNPTKEMMYIPTSKDAKFKSKGWIDTFGSRFAKAGGAQITDKFKQNLPELMVYGSLFGFGLIGIWFGAALYVGLKNSKLLKEGKIIE
jgi:ATP:ADP antiporter, AAA family